MNFSSPSSSWGVPGHGLCLLNPSSLCSLGGPYYEFSLCVSLSLQQDEEPLLSALAMSVSYEARTQCQTRLFARLVLAWGILHLFPVHLLSPPVCKVAPDYQTSKSVRQFRSEGTFEGLWSNPTKTGHTLKSDLVPQCLVGESFEYFQDRDCTIDIQLPCSTFYHLCC